MVKKAKIELVASKGVPQNIIDTINKIIGSIGASNDDKREKMPVTEIKK